MTRTNTPADWDDFLLRHTVGDAVAVTVTRTLPFGALVETVEGIPGLLWKAGPVDVGARVEARLDAIDPVQRRVSLVGG
ncbi:hypothetical protein [Plantactinospora endophytica]|uniref:S1 motif domain-containing protein n=1 Tax=Plantactinospora endophytica TaxID=673535 RepID=A0ABQ4EA01_9ACTN|nr:hypothetical protein [Plantactinospora endophytica]GIG91552.1 hypothetical protein Pen02_64880 [Plantactinospora endophytica]